MSLSDWVLTPQRLPDIRTNAGGTSRLNISSANRQEGDTHKDRDDVK